MCPPSALMLPRRFTNHCASLAAGSLQLACIGMRHDLTADSSLGSSFVTTLAWANSIVRDEVRMTGNWSFSHTAMCGVLAMSLCLLRACPFGLFHYYSLPLSPLHFAVATHCDYGSVVTSINAPCGSKDEGSLVPAGLTLPYYSMAVTHSCWHR